MIQLVKQNRAASRSLLDELFDNNFFLNPFINETSSTKKNSLALNVKENEKHFNLEFVAPGVQKENFKISIDKEILTVSNTSESTETPSDYIRQEFNFSVFNKSIKLPENIDIENIKATHKNGILTITLPKAKVKTQKIKTITIN